MLTRLQKRLNLKTVPTHIECIDTSTLSGVSPVASMVVFEAGKEKKPSYRLYGIKTVPAANAPDDYAYMAEILKRRFGKGAQSEPFPDLLMVDGGKGQLNIPGFDHYRMNQLDLCGTSGLAPYYLSLKRSLDLLLSHDVTTGTTISWSAPAQPGGLSSGYEVVRSSNVRDFVTAPLCLIGDDPTQVSIQDDENPCPGCLYAYLVRATNECPSGDGSLGRGSNNRPRPGPSCQ